MRSNTYRQIQHSNGESKRSLIDNVLELLQENPDSYQPLRHFIQAVHAFQASTDTLSHRFKELFIGLSFPNTHSDTPAKDQLFVSTSLVLSMLKERTTLSHLIEHLKEIQQQNFIHQACISVTTLHKSKGLEFSHVCILGNQNNIFPHFGLTKNKPEAVAEERRLLYVGMTRSQKELHLSNHTAPQNEEFTHRDGFLNEITDFLT